MLTILNILFLLNVVLLLLSAITHPFLQATGYLAASLLCLLNLIGLITLYPLTIIGLLLIKLLVLIWFSYGFGELISQTPQLVLRLSLKFKIALLGAALWLTISFVSISSLMFNLTLPLYLALFSTVPSYFILSLLAYYFNSIRLLHANLTTPQNQILLIFGAGLTDGIQPGPELKRRSNKAVALNQATDTDPLIIVTGGQGPDERQPEAAAMRTYLITHHINAKQIIMEDQSRNTWENLVNSQRLINQHFSYQPTVAAISSHYHLLRICLYARKLNFTVRPVGISGSSRLYASSSIREWISILLMHPYQHCLFALIFTIIINLIQIINR